MNFSNLPKFFAKELLTELELLTHPAFGIPSKFTMRSPEGCP